jgi:NAD(P)-dependent dehydrogenase (short-subunit alcohol dehydrogenase family)
VSGTVERDLTMALSINLDGRVVVITGGAGGIGEATAGVLARAGARVVVTDVDPAAGAATVTRVGALDGVEPSQVRFERLDVTSPEEAESLADRLEADGWPVDGVFANAGIAPSSAAAEYPDALWRTTLDINLNGVFWTVRAFGRRAIAAGRAAAVVVTSSIAGVGVVSPETHAAYGTSKAAVAHLASLLGVEWAPHGIRVNALGPGYTATPILDALKAEAPDVYQQWLDRIPTHRLNTPEEIANGVAFLLSDLASGITGATLMVDNGYSAR